MNIIRFLPISYKLFSDMTFSVPSFLLLAVVGYPNLGLLNILTSEGPGKK